MKFAVPEERLAEFEEWLRDRGEGWERGEDIQSSMLRIVVVRNDPVIAAKVRALRGRPCP